MKKLTITKSFEFDAAHRVLNHESKCKNLHGHRYKAEVTVTAPELDELGRVIDFGCLKTTIGKWIDENWDHNTLLNVKDPIVNLLLPGTLTPVTQIIVGREPAIFIGNPTAENISKKLFSIAVSLVPEPIKVLKVRIYETPSCYADYEVTEIIKDYPQVDFSPNLPQTPPDME